jgi:hypothetical protein
MPTGLHVTGGLTAHQDWGVPKGQYFHDLTLEGDGTGTGIFCDASYVVFERCWVRNVYHNVVLSNAVSVTFRDCNFSRAKMANFYIPPSVVTCIRFDGCAFREAPYGVVIQSGQGITFTNRCIIESNSGAGLVISPIVNEQAPFFGDIVNDASSPIWFEANGPGGYTGIPIHIVGEHHLVTK